MALYTCNIYNDIMSKLTKKAICITLDINLLKKMDLKRGLVDRSTWIESLLMEKEVQHGNTKS